MAAEEAAAAAPQTAEGGGGGGEKILIVYYSRTGATAAVARKLAEHFGGDSAVDVVELKPRENMLGAWGWIRCAYIGAGARDVALVEESAAETLSFAGRYRQVWLGSPIHAGLLSGAARTWLARNAEKIRAAPGVKVCVFCTHGGGDPAKLFAQAQQTLGAELGARVAVPGKEVASFDPATAAI